jgi:hypothetical protein
VNLMKVHGKHITKYYRETFPAQLMYDNKNVFKNQYLFYITTMNRLKKNQENNLIHNSHKKLDITRVYSYKLRYTLS